MTNDIKTATRKVGSNRGKPRLWIEGKLLIDAGLDHGQRWDIVQTDEGLRLLETRMANAKSLGNRAAP